jgi:hypothetical protein
MFSCLEVLSISTSICFVHLQSLLKITPNCLCICTGDNEIKIYLVFIQPILEYASEDWDNCGQTNCNHLEKIQIEAARIMTGFSIYASFDSIYKETGWDTFLTCI